MKIKKNLKKAGIGLLVSAVAISGAFAWLTNTDIANKQNELVVGNIDIKFENQLNAVELTANDSIPMTKAYAIEHLTAYTFDIANKGSVDLDYIVSIDADTFTNSFPENSINVLIAPIEDGATEEEIRTALTNATVKKVSAGKDLASASLNKTEHKRYAMIAYIDKSLELAEYNGASISFKIRVDAVQHNVLNAENYETLSKSQISTTVTVGGESKNVEVYNIEGDSKTDLLEKLDKSGLTDTSTVDAIVEVCGDDYDGMNSTATFDVSSIANPGDEVVILHFNETTQEWEYIGRETVAEDSTVSGDFTSYSPVAFVVYKPNGSIVTKEYDSDTGELIKETEVKSDGSKIETEYSNGEISNIKELAKPIDLTNVNITDGTKILVAGDFSTKGNLVTINDTQYRVLSVDGTQAKVMSMDNSITSKYNNSFTKTMFGEKEGQKYADSVLDRAMIAYYDSLPSTIKTLIIPQTISQSMYPWVKPIAAANKEGEITIGTRYVYALDVDDVLEYLGTGYTENNLMKMFFNIDDSETPFDINVWLRSAYSNNEAFSAFVVSGPYGELRGNWVTTGFEIRPSFVIDLSLLS